LFTEIQGVQCPYCGEAIEIVIDVSIESQAYIEDCSVCCRPMELSVSVADGETDVVARRDDE